jgi:hypothetical protein
MSAALAQALRDGPTPVPEAIARCTEILSVGLVDQQAEVLATLHLGYLYALADDLVRARELCRQARARLTDLGGGALTASSIASLTIGRIELLAGETTIAITELRREYEVLGSMGERYFRPVVGALLAQAVCSSGAHSEAIEITCELELMAADDDIEAQAVWRSARAKALAAKDEAVDALRLTSDAVSLLAGTDAVVWKAESLVDQAIVFLQVGMTEEGTRALLEARELYMLKGARLALHRVDALLAGAEFVAASSHGGSIPAADSPSRPETRAARRRMQEATLRSA